MVRVDHVGGRVRNRPVKQPIAGGGHAKALGASFQWEHFAGDDPCNRSPGASEKENVNAHEGDGSFLRVPIDIARIHRGIGGHTNTPNDELANTHSDCTHKQKVASSQLFDKIQARESGRNVDRVCDDCVDERVREACVRKVLRAVVDCNLSVLMWLD